MMSFTLIGFPSPPDDGCKKPITYSYPFIFLIIAGTSLFAHLALVWLYRFVPSVDYPEWLLQSNILAHYNDASNNYSQWYERVIAPVPNAGFVMPTAVLAAFLPIEIAGKIVLSLYIVWLHKTG